MYILKRFSLLSVIFIFLLYKVKEIEHEKQVSHQANPARRSQVLYKLDWQPDHTTRTNLYKRLNHDDDHKAVFTADELNSTDLHQVDPVTRLVIGHARQRRHLIGCSAAVRELQFSSVQFVRYEHGLIHLKAATHEQTPTADTAISDCWLPGYTSRRVAPTFVRSSWLMSGRRVARKKRQTTSPDIAGRQSDPTAVKEIK